MFTTMASATASESSTFIEIKDAYSSGVLPQALKNFNISTIITYFLHTHSDFRSIREVSYELFTNGHVRNICVREDVTAEKTLIKAQCLAHMRQRSYDIVMIVHSKDADILHASCRCEDGQGPLCTCKHVAALCYALEEFVKEFILPEDIPSCTDKLEAWNKPRDVKLPATPLFDISFERKKYGKKRKEKRELKGARPEWYSLHQTCDSDRTAVSDFLADLQKWSRDNKTTVLLNTVVDIQEPIETVSSVNHLYHYMSNFIHSLDTICSSDDVSLDDLTEVLKVTVEQQKIVEQNTLLQSRTSDWFTLRKYRITGSVVHRVCNYYLHKRSNPENIVKAIMEPSAFTSAAMRLGLEFEPRVLQKYVESSKSNNIDIVLKKIGLMIDTEYGFLAASPDSGIFINDQLVAIVEVKTKVADKWSRKPIADCAKDSSYPLKLNDQASNTSFTLKETSQWFHQIQLQLLVCRSFAQYCDLVVYHIESSDSTCVRIKPNQSWVNKHLPKFEQFFKNFMAPKIIAKHKSGELAD